MARPTPIEREDKVLGQANDRPVEEKYTYQNANEDRDKINETINYLPLYLSSNENGVIASEFLSGIHIGYIKGVGAEFFEYDGTASEATEFSKDLDESRIMEANTHTPMVFLANSKFILYPR